jgi:hypothetical protein
MSTWNMPPGVTTADIPGNEPTGSARMLEHRWAQVPPLTGERAQYPAHVESDAQRIARLAGTVGEMTAEARHLRAELDAMKHPPKPIGPRWQHYERHTVTLGKADMHVLVSFYVDEDLHGRTSSEIDDLLIWFGGEWMAPAEAFGDNAGDTLADELVDAITLRLEGEAAEAAEEAAISAAEDQGAA